MRKTIPLGTKLMICLIISIGLIYTIGMILLICGWYRIAFK